MIRISNIVRRVGYTRRPALPTCASVRARRAGSAASSSGAPAQQPAVAKESTATKLTLSADPPAPPAPASLVVDANESTWQIIRRLTSKQAKGAARKDGAPEDPPSQLDRVTLRRLIELARPEAVPLTAAVATLGITSAISLLFPFAIGQILDAALVTEGAAWSPGAVSGGLLGLFVIQSGLIVARSALLTISGERISARLRKELFRAMLGQDVAWFDGQRTGDLVNRLSSDTALVQKALTTNIASGLRSLTMGLGGAAMLFYLSPALAALSVGLIPPVAVAGMAYGRYVQGQQAAVQAALGRTTEVSEEALGSLRTVRLFAGEAAEASRFGARVDDSFVLARRIGIVAAYFDGAVHMAANVSLVAVLWYGGDLVVSGAMTAGDLTSFLMYSLYVGFNLGGLSSVYSELKRAAGGAARIFEVMDRAPAMPLTADARVWADRPPASDASSSSSSASPAPPSPVPSALVAAPGVADAGLIRLGPDALAGALAWRGVSFAYPARPGVPVLADFSLAVPARTHVALVGASGCGKSTAASLLARLYDPGAGAVELDGVDVRRLDPSWLRGSVVGYVPQDPALFAASIADNIRYGRPGASDAEVEAAARLANAHDFIAAAPQGYGTLVGERGVQLSGGQRQRVAIARAVIKDPRVVVLDEATSALDSAAEAAILRALEAVSRGRTVVTIAHRLSTMRSCDLVAVIEGGRVAEVGPFARLAADPRSAFRRLFAKQLQQLEEGGASEQTPEPPAA